MNDALRRFMEAKAPKIEEALRPTAREEIKTTSWIDVAEEESL